MKESFAFGVRVPFAQSEIALLPVPWEAGASYGRGSAMAPLCIKNSSHYMDFFTRDYGAYNHLLYFFPQDEEIQKLNQRASAKARRIISILDEGKALSSKEKSLTLEVRQASLKMVRYVREESEKILSAGKIPGLIGGDHSVSEGLLSALSARHKGNYGILHVDAHMDLRKSYQGFDRSHASIMRRVLEMRFPPHALIQVGVRDFSKEEWDFSRKTPPVTVYFDEDLQKRIFAGESWLHISQEIISRLPSNIYISLDVDGLEWSLAPQTGAPVPGGLSYYQVLFLLQEAARRQKTLLGFDVVETACLNPKESSSHTCWNGNVSARLIYQLSALALFGAAKL